MKAVFTTFLKGGPVGLWHAWRLHRLRARMRFAQWAIEHERANHRAQMQALRCEIERVAQLQTEAAFEAATFWKGL